jgi:NifU-like protein involved in Fe-S cluster formation
MLTENGPIPQKPFENLEVLIPAITYKNRHASIMLSFEAIIDAFSNIKNI